MVAPAMRGGLWAIAAAFLAVAAAGCGGQRQDANEPSGRFKVEVVDASFPAKQAIAQATVLRIRVRNADTKAIPDVAVTVETRPRDGSAPIAFGQAVPDPTLADQSKPVWILDKGPAGADTAYTNTWALGRLEPGQSRTFEWRLTAVHAGRYTVGYTVFPGLNGKAKPAGGRTRGTFQVTISDQPVPAHVDTNGNVVRGEEAGRGGAVTK